MPSCTFIFSSDRLLAIHFGHLLQYLCWLFVEPPDYHLIHYGKQEVLACINAMEPEYEDVLAWVDPRPARPGTSGAGSSSMETTGPWGEATHIFGAV